MLLLLLCAPHQVPSCKQQKMEHQIGITQFSHPVVSGEASCKQAEHPQYFTEFVLDFSFSFKLEHAPRTSLHGASSQLLPSPLPWQLVAPAAPP